MSTWLGLAWPLLPLSALLLVPLSYWGALRWVNGRRRPGEPPLIRGRIPGLGVALDFGRNATEFVTRCRERYGETFTLFIGGRRMTFVLDPMSYPAVLKSKQLSFHPVSDAVLQQAFKLPDIAAQIDLPAAEDLARSHLKGEALNAMTDAMGERLRELMPEAVSESWEEHALYALVWRLMFRAGTDTLFGRGLVTPQLAEDFEVFDEQFPLMVAGLPRQLVRRGEEALQRLAAVPPMGDDPSPWIRDRHPLFEGVDPTVYGRAQTSILWAVNANTIPATFWAVYQLLGCPEGLDAVRRELADVGIERAHDLDIRGLEGLRKLDSAIREALRLSSGSMTVREALEDCTLETRDGTHRLRRGDRVCLAPFITHRDVEIYPDPERYIFDRFYIPSGVKTFTKGGERVPLPLMPFGAGASMCPGRFFALNEIKLFVATALLEWEMDFAAAKGAPPRFDFSRAGLGIYPPMEDVSVRIRQRPPM